MQTAVQTHLQSQIIARPVEERISRWPWLCTGAVLFLLHASLSFAFPEQGWITCLGIGVAYCMAAVFCLRKASLCRGILRAKWTMLAVAFMLRAGRDVAILYGAYILRFEPQRAWIHSAMGLLMGVPLLFVVSSTDDDDEPRAFAWLDAVQLLLITALFLFDVFPGAYFRGQSNWYSISISDYAHLRTLELLGLTMLAALRTYAAVSASRRSFYTNLVLLAGLMQLLYLLNDFVAEHGATAGSPFFALSDLPPLIFVTLGILGFRFVGMKLATPLRLWISSMIRFASPAFFALAVLLLSVQVMPSSPHIGVWTSCAGLAVYGVRSAFLQLRFQRAQNRLLLAQSELLAASRRDPLTELYNRRWFDQTHRHEWAHAATGHHPISLLMIDIDHFKEFNDAAGHKAGDQCLIAVAGALRKTLQREGDSVSRYGGEEFAVILPFTEAKGALVVAERMRQAVEALQYAHPGASQEYVTISIGIASTTPSTPTAAPDELFLLADAALYQAKQRGRNRVEIGYSPHASTKARQGNDLR